MSMYIGEALAGDGNEIAHIDLLIGNKEGPVGTAFANALANQSHGHSNLLAVLTPNLLCKPATILITKVTIKGLGQAVQMFGPAQASVAKAVSDSVAAGVIPKDQADNLCIICGVFIHPEAKDDTKIYQYNYEATKLAVQRAMRNEPKIEEILAKKDSASIRSHQSKFLEEVRSQWSVVRSRIATDYGNGLLTHAFMDKRKILIQIDSDPQPSVFDRVVAIDAGADELFSYGGVKPEQVRDIVHGAIFTRGPKDLKSTALFVGGSDVTAGERLMQEAVKHMLPQFGLRVSILLDANGANTTAAAAVRAAGRHVPLQGVPALVLGGTGPVGQRVARLLARQGADVRVGSRQQNRAAAVCEAIRSRVSQARLEPVATGTSHELATAVAGRALIIAAGAAGALLLPRSARPPQLRIAIDLNAVPPLGIEGVDVTDKGVEKDGVIGYGAIGVGDTKMKIHKLALARLFERNDQVMDAEEVFEFAEGLA